MRGISGLYKFLSLSHSIKTEGLQTPTSSVVMLCVWSFMIVSLIVIEKTWVQLVHQTIVLFFFFTTSYFVLPISIMLEGKFNMKLIPGFDGLASGLSVVKWVEKSELVCKMCIVKHLEHIISLRLLGGAFGVY